MERIQLLHISGLGRDATQRFQKIPERIKGYCDCDDDSYYYHDDQYYDHDDDDDYGDNYDHNDKFNNRSSRKVEASS
jgi:hypothetical protein